MTIHVKTIDSVTWVTIDRQEIQNRVDRAACLAIVAAFRAADDDPAIRAVVLTAAGSLFCSGGQVDGAGSGDGSGQIAFADAFAGVHRAAAALGKPLIVAVNGPAAAGGFSLVLAADLAITVDTATFGLPELAAGAFPMLALAVAAPLLPRKLLFDLVYNARLLSAEEALAHHLVSAIVPAGELEAAVTAQADRIKAANPVAIALGRRAYEAMRALPPDAALSHGGLALVQMSSTKSGRDAVAALARGEH